MGACRVIRVVGGGLIAALLLAGLPFTPGTDGLAGLGAKPALAEEAPPAAAEGMPEIAWERFTLPNGLTVVVHEDHRAPIVGVMVWYHVGSRNETPGRTGFAHLFEHLMFNGSEHHDDDWFKPLVRFGATGVNGTTNTDRTNYFQVVPTSALDTILWLESDRMGWTLPAVTQARLDEQRGVVQNEKRQREGEPYGLQWEAVTQSTWPAGHPYSWTTIGSMEDLQAASLDDVNAFFRAWYGPDNAVLVVTGDVETATVKEKIAHYFGDIPPGPPVRRFKRLEVPRTVSTRMEMEDRVSLPRVVRVWNTPGWGTADGDHLDHVAAVLGDGASSRLARRLQDALGLASDVEVFQDSMEIAGQFWLQVTAAPGVDAADLERAMDAEMAAFLEKGPTIEEIALARARREATFLRNLERVGGFGGKADLLAEGQVFGGSPDAWKTTWQRRAAATPGDLMMVARKWLSRGDFTLTIRPRPAHAPATTGADRKSMPAPGEPPAAKFPDVDRTRLENGLSVVSARRAGAPLAEVRLLIPAGHGALGGAAPGTARLTADLLTRGTASRNAHEIARDADLLGATLVATAGVEWTTLALSVPTAKVREGMALLADVALRPSFPEEEVRRTAERLAAAESRERVDARTLVPRVLPRLLYGEEHPLGVSHTGVASMKPDRDAVLEFHRARYVAGGSRLLMAGDFDATRARALAEEAFGSWTGEAPFVLPVEDATPKPGLYLVDLPGAVQSTVVVASFVPPAGNAALDVLHHLFCGSFTGRVNMNLREDKHWSYGTRGRMQDLSGDRPFSIVAPVQTDRTAESLAEILREIRDLHGERLPMAEEVSDARRSMTLTLTGRWETTRAVADALVDQESLSLGDTYQASTASRIGGVTLEQVQGAVGMIPGENLVLLVIGDRSKVEEPLSKLGMGKPILLNADGQPGR